MSSTEIRNIAIILAAGRGERVGGDDGPKQYRKVGAKAVLEHAASAFFKHPAIDRVLIVTHRDDQGLYDELGLKHEKLLRNCTGGATRQASALAGLQALTALNPSNALIHDAARPFVDDGIIDRVLRALDEEKAALPALPVTDTLKRHEKNDFVSETIPRDGLFAAQTPQGFRFETILKLHRNAANEASTEFTDDASIAEWGGINVVLVDGTKENTKITTAWDLTEAHAKMNVPVPDIRVGHGYDTHQLVSGDHVWLCGVKITHTHTLSGHSDADVGLHALTDALLATIADGDIGSHFPPSDAKWKDARSDQFLKYAVSRIQEQGGTITHMDVTLICEAPKIGPHRDAMRQVIADASGVDMSRIAVKATTNEQVGFIGRGEGIVATATATVVMGTL